MDLTKWLNKIPFHRCKPWITDTPIPVSLDILDICAVFCVSVVSYFVRFKIFQHPNCVVFDEIHFGNFTNFYINRQFFFDIHPPLAKFLIATESGLAEYEGNIPFADLYGNEYPDEHYISIRIMPILLSSLAPAMLYLAVRFASFSKTAALIPACFACFETTMICEGKFILTDGILHFFTGFGLAVTNYWLSIPRSQGNWLKWRYLACFAIGCAFSCKSTALSLCFIIGYDQFCDLLLSFDFQFDEEFYRAFCWRILEIAGPAFALHFGLWFIHFARIPYVGPDTSVNDQKSYNLFNLSDPTTLHWKAFYMPPVIGRVLGTVMSIQLSNAMNYKPHPYMSRPIDWPLLTDVWVGFWSRGNMQVSCVGNVFNFYLSFLGVLICTFSFMKLKRWSKIIRFVIGYWLSYIPFFGVPRTMFLYHYIIPLMFAMMCFGIAVDLYVPPYWRGFVAVLVICLSAFGYYVFSPLVYATPLSDAGARIWNPAWRYGRPGRQKWVEYMERKAAEIENLTGSDD